MGEALLSAMREKGVSTAADVRVSEPVEARRHYLHRQFGISVTGSNREAVQGGEVVVLVIKPQNLTEVMADLNGQLKPSQLVLSIVAGATIGTLRRGLSHPNIVRAMPNTPAQIGEGMSVWTATPEVTEEQKKWASSILEAIGREIYVDDEKYLDMATAVSGSGPAYFFLFAEVLVDSAVELGLPRDMAKELVLQTMLGSGHLIQQSDKELAELRRMVTSPGGTTEAALKELEKGGFNQLLKRAVKAAYARAKQLGGESS